MGGACEGVVVTPVAPGVGVEAAVVVVGASAVVGTGDEETGGCWGSALSPSDLGGSAVLLLLSGLASDSWVGLGLVVELGSFSLACSTGVSDGVGVGTLACSVSGF